MENVSVDVQGLKLAAIAHGPESGIPLLALHGWSDNAASFEKLAPLLPEHRVVALELPGHGWSEPRPVGQTYHFIDWVPVVFDAADALGWTEFCLLGHSMGASIASLAAGVFPERILRLGLIEGLGPLSGSEDEVPARLRRYMTGRIAQTRRKAYPSEDAAIARLRAAASHLSEDAARRLVRRGTREAEGGLVWRSDPRLHDVSPWRFTEGQVRSFLLEITAPTTAIRATGGHPFDESILNGRLQCISTHRLIQVPGNHHVHLEDPEAVAPALREGLTPTP